MFICSMKVTKKKVYALLALFLAVIVFLSVIILLKPADASAATNITNQSVKAETDTERVAFLQSFGWQCDPKPVAMAEVIIPAEFDEIYQEYNVMQKAQGMDLSKYKGKRVKKWTYMVTNYPEYDQAVYANILVFEDKIVGGDITATNVENGFTHGFKKNANTETSAEQTVQSVTCQCKSGGECTCPTGQCTCKENTSKNETANEAGTAED